MVGDAIGAGLDHGRCAKVGEAGDDWGCCKNKWAHRAHTFFKKSLLRRRPARVDSLSAVGFQPAGLTSSTIAAPNDDPQGDPGNEWLAT